MPYRISYKGRKTARVRSIVGADRTKLSSPQPFTFKSKKDAEAYVKLFPSFKGKDARVYYVKHKNSPLRRR